MDPKTFYITKGINGEIDAAELESFEFKCKNGIITVNKDFLLKQTSKFDAVLKEKNQNFIDMPEYDVTTCKCFLDLLMNFKELDRHDSLLILPIVKRFGIEDLYKKLVINLKPILMDEMVVHTLNVSIAHGCEFLKDAVIDFLLSYGINLLFLQKEYYLLLSPKSVLVLLRIIEKNDMIFSSIIEWGRHYIDKNNISDDLRSFFLKCGILVKFSIDNISPECILQSYQTDAKKNIFTAEEILNHLTKISTAAQVENISEWIDTKEEQVFAEIFDLRYPVLVSAGTELTFQFNPVIYEYSLSKENFKVFECQIKLLFSKIDKDKGENTDLELTTFKILKSEVTGLQCERSVMIQNSENSKHLVLTDIIVHFYFYKNCKVLLARTDLSSIFKEKNQLTFIKSIILL